jgi:hypothetical protein
VAAPVNILACIEGGVCKLSFYIAPLFTSEGFTLRYIPTDYSDGPHNGHDSDDPHYIFDYRLVLATLDGLSGPSSFDSYTGDISSIELPSGKKFSFNRYGLWSWYDIDDEPIYTNYSGNDALNSRMKEEVGPTVIIDGTLKATFLRLGQPPRIASCLVR